MGREGIILRENQPEEFMSFGVIITGIIIIIEEGADTFVQCHKTILKFCRLCKICIVYITILNNSCNGHKDINTITIITLPPLSLLPLIPLIPSYCPHYHHSPHRRQNINENINQTTRKPIVLYRHRESRGLWGGETIYVICISKQAKNR